MKVHFFTEAHLPHNQNSSIFRFLLYDLIKKNKALQSFACDCNDWNIINCSDVFLRFVMLFTILTPSVQKF